MASKNSNTNAELLYQLKQIQEGQNEILRTVSEIANTGLASSMGTQLTANKSELNGKPSLTRVLFSDKSIEVFNPIKDQKIKLLLCDRYTKMEIALKNLKPMEASFQLYRLFERLSPLIINHIAELELKELANGDTTQTELTTLLAGSFRKGKQKDSWERVYNNGEDYKLSTTQPATLEFPKKPGFESKCVYFGETLKGEYIYIINKDDEEFVFVDSKKIHKKTGFEGEWEIKNYEFKNSEDNFKLLNGKSIVWQVSKRRILKPLELLELNVYNSNLGFQPLPSNIMTQYILKTLIQLNPETSDTFEDLDESLKIVVQGRHDYAHTNIKNKYTNDKTFHSISQLSGYIKTFMVLYKPNVIV